MRLDDEVMTALEEAALENARRPLANGQEHPHHRTQVGPTLASRRRRGAVYRLIRPRTFSRTATAVL
jgi:hypothetical protein